MQSGSPDETFFAYQYTIYNMPTIHLGDCPHCRAGRGQNKLPQFKLSRTRGFQPGWFRLVEEVKLRNVRAWAAHNKMRLCGLCLNHRRDV